MRRVVHRAALAAAMLAFAAPPAAAAGGAASCIALHNSAEASSSPGALATEFRQFAGAGFGGAIVEIAQSPRNNCPPE